MKTRNEYMRRAIDAGWVLRFAPFIRMLGLNGSLVRGEESEESDIDFLVIAKRGRLYTTRFFTIILAELTGYRRKGDKVAGRICLNCYLPDNKLDISPKDKKSREKVAKAYKYLIALIDAEDYENEFFRANEWFSRYKVNGKQYNQSLRKIVLRLTLRNPIGLCEGVLSGKFGDWLEKKLMEYQIKRIKAGKKKGDEIVCTKSEIRLHPRKIKY